ncbi:MAG: DUF11 domain-containing protein [Verrucomicrobia bacterium]|nr:DUF11 domain-containing protein [Verrucomicrobiota bacterium]
MRFECRWTSNLRQRLWRCLWLLAALVEINPQSLKYPTCLASPCGLIAWWPGDEHARDLFGSNHGTLLDGTNYVSGKVGHAVSFDGIDDGLEIPNANRVFDLVAAWTVEAWVMPLTDGFDYRNGPIVWKVARNGLNEDTFFLAWHGENMFATGLERAFDGADLLIASRRHETNQFYHVAGSYDGNELRIYVNGVLENSEIIGPTRAYTGPAPLRIGNNLNSNHGFAGVFQGVIDEVAIYNRALAVGEVALLYDAGKKGKCKTGFPPNVSLRSPIHGATFAAPATITLDAEACSSRGAIARVEFYQGSVLLGQLASLPYALLWTNAPVGEHTITARAIDQGGAIGISSPVSITVAGPEPLPTLTIADASVVEGNSANTNVLVNVRLSKPVRQTVAVGYSSSNGTATAGSDYSALAGMLFFPPGETNQTIDALVLGDREVEPDETFAIHLNNATNAVIARRQAEVTIVNDDAINRPPNVELITPLNRSVFPTGADINLLATATDADGSVERVEFYAGSRWLGRALSRPYSLTWSNVNVGDYVFAAVATDNLGLTNRSEIVQVAVSDFTAEVAIVEATRDPETVRLQEYLFEMGLSSRVFDNAATPYETLRRFKLVIWNDAGSTNLSGFGVDTFHQLLTNGIPLYFIGEDLASSASQLNEPQRSRWINLTSLNPANRKGGSGRVVVSEALQTNPILAGRFGLVEDFDYTNRLDLSSVAAAEAQVFGQSDGADILIGYPRLDEPDFGVVRTFTQNCRVTGDSGSSISARKALFQNVVCWLMRCPSCHAIDLSLEGAVSSDASATVGKPVTFSVLLRHSGECEATGVVVTNWLPSNVRFVSAESARGTWSHEGNVVVFTLGHLANGSETLINIVAQPTAAGPATNVVQVRVNGPEVTLENNLLKLVSVIERAFAPILALVPLPGGGYELALTGSAGQRYAVESSTSLEQWTALTNVVAVGETVRFVDSSVPPLDVKQRFYRARLLAP